MSLKAPQSMRHEKVLRRQQNVRATNVGNWNLFYHFDPLHRPAHGKDWQLQNGSLNSADADRMSVEGLSHHFGKSARCLLSPTADSAGAIPITECHYARTASEAMRLAQKEIAVASGRFRILIHGDDDRLDVLVAPAFSRIADRGSRCAGEPTRSSRIYSMSLSASCCNRSDTVRPNSLAVSRFMTSL